MFDSPGAPHGKAHSQNTLRPRMVRNVSPGRHDRGGIQGPSNVVGRDARTATLSPGQEAPGRAIPAPGTDTLGSPVGRYPHGDRTEPMGYVRPPAAHIRLSQPRNRPYGQRKANMKGRHSCHCKRCFVTLQCSNLCSKLTEPTALYYCERCAPFTPPRHHQGCDCVGCVASRKAT